MDVPRNTPGIAQMHAAAARLKSALDFALAGKAQKVYGCGHIAEHTVRLDDYECYFHSEDGSTYLRIVRVGHPTEDRELEFDFTSSETITVAFQGADFATYSLNPDSSSQDLPHFDTILPQMEKFAAMLGEWHEASTRLQEAAQQKGRRDDLRTLLDGLQKF